MNKTRLAMHTVTPPHPFDRSLRLYFVIGTTVVVFRPSRALKVMYQRLNRKFPPVSLRITRSIYQGPSATVEGIRQKCAVNSYVDHRNLTLFFYFWLLVMLQNAQHKDFLRPYEFSGHHSHLLATHLFPLYTPIHVVRGSESW